MKRVWGLLMVLWLLMPQIGWAAQEPRQVVVVTVNRLGYEDLERMPELRKLAQSGALGLMNINSAARGSQNAAYATIAGGVPVKLGGKLAVHEAGEPVEGVKAEEVFRQRIGETEGSQVLVLSMAQLLRRHDQREFAGQPGALGEALRAAGVKTAVYGSGDEGNEPWRPGALLTANGLGRTAYGLVGERAAVSAPERAYGMKTDYEALWRGYEAVERQVGLAVFDLGDLHRLARYKEQLSEERYEALRGQVLGEIDAFVQRLKPSENRMVLVVAPQVSREAAERKAWLAPLVAAGGEVQAGSVLTSATTRREGIVSNVDLAPTVLAFLGVEKPREMIGYPLQGTSDRTQAELGGLLERTAWTFAHRGAVLGGVGAVIGAALLLAAARLWAGSRVPLAAVRGLLWASLAMPLCLLLVPLVGRMGTAVGLTGTTDGMMSANGTGSLIGVAFSVLVIGIVSVGLPFLYIRSLLGRLVWLCGATVCAVVLDAFLGSPLAKSAFLSYDPIVGARYYGVGNEYMGVVVGASVLLYAAVLQSGRFKEPLVAYLGSAGGVLLTLFFASPLLGTNTGGALTMAGTTAICCALHKKLRPRTILLKLFIGLGLAVGVLLWLNATGASTRNAPSHIGMATHQVLQGGGAEILRILARKTDMFRRLFVSSVGPALLLAAVFLFARLLLGPMGKKAPGYERFLLLVVGLLGGGFVGLVTNDSGIVVLAMVALFAIFGTLLVWLEDEASVREELLARIA